jgi:hypothetical protein
MDLYLGVSQMDEPLTWTYTCDFCGEHATREHYVNAEGFGVCYSCERKFREVCNNDEAIQSIKSKIAALQEKLCKREFEIAKSMLTKERAKQQESGEQLMMRLRRK